ncbi:hypothetical protein [Methylorubrum sp. SB2]|uniref:hypothetical protein n=1 Tax=Methylorubrum subtropicum TaxID=3138812 RepID=UPI00313D6DAC
MDRSARDQDKDRTPPADEGLARFEVEGLDADRALLRALARRLAEPGDGAAALRKAVASAVEGTKGVESAQNVPPKRGGVLAALRNSPLVGADLDLRKTRHPGRDVDP